MNGFIITTLALCSFYCGLFAAPARAEWVRYQNYKVKIDAPKDWKTETDLYGIPVTALGPDRGGERAVVLIQHTELKGVTFAQKDLAGQQDEYIKARKAWLEKADDSVFKSALPPVFHSKPNGINGYEFAYRYHLREHEFEEHSAQISCHGNVYLIKTLSNEKNTKQDLKALGNILDHFECSSVTKKDGPYVPGPLHDIQDALKEYRASEWPGLQDYQKASSTEKGQSLEALVEFYKRYDEASVPEDEDFSSAPSKANLLFQNFVQKLNQLFPAANADGNYDCFFGGWPSKRVPKNGSLTCDYPEHQNEEYKKLAAACGPGQMLCNPSLFGSGLCVGTQDTALRRHATLECELKLNASGKTFEAVTKEKDYDEKLLNETIESAKAVCNSTEYVSSNYGLCHTLQQKLSDSIALQKHQKGAGDQDFADQLETMKPKDLEATLKEVDDHWAPFQKKCLNEKGDINPAIPECAGLAQKFIADFETIEKAKAKAKDDLNPNKPAPSINCPSGNCDGKEVEHVPAPQGTCTEAETKRMNDPANACHWGNPAWIMKGPFRNIFMSMLGDLWGTVTGVWDLGKSALVGAGHLLGFGHADDQSSDKAHLTSQTGDSFLSSLRHKPMETAAALWQSLVDQVMKFADNDLLCQQWSGLSHLSHCDIAANHLCLSCTDKANGMSSLIGYAVGEGLPFILSGGAISLAKKSDMVLKMGEFLSKSSRMGKLVKYAAEVQSKLPALSKIKVGLIERGAIIAEAAKKLEAVKASLSVLEKWSGKFKSIYGSAAKTLEALKEKSRLVRATAWVGRMGSKAAVKTVGFVAKLPSVPGELLYKGSFKLTEKVIDRQILNAVEKETVREVESGIAKTVPVYVSPIATELPVNTAKVATKVTNYANDITAAEDVEARPGFIGRAFQKRKDKLPAGIAEPVDNFFTKRTAKKQAKFEKLLEKQNELLAELKMETDPAIYAQMTPEERLDQIKRAQKYGYFKNRKLNKNADKIEKAVQKSGTKIELPSRAEETPFASTYLRKALATLPSAKFFVSAASVIHETKAQVYQGHDQTELEIIAKRNGKTVEQTKSEEIEQKELSPEVQELVWKGFYQQPFDTKDLAQLQKAHVTVDKIHELVNNLYVLQLGCIIMDASIKHQNFVFSDDQKKRQATLGQTDDQLLKNVKVLTDNPDYQCPKDEEKKE